MPIIECHQVSKKYLMGKVTVDAIQQIDRLIINQGEFVAIEGPSGSGKTTLLNMIGGLDRPTSGKISVNGKFIWDLSAIALAKLRAEKIGFIFQFFNLIPHLSVLDNVEIVSRFVETPKFYSERKEKALHLLNLIGLGNRTNHKPEELSGGQRQRVAIARALMNEPDIILADEPTGNLDSKTSSEIIDTFLRLKDMGKTIILVTHNHQFSTKTDRIIYIIDGKVEYEESMTSIKN